ncbi:endospore germination permease [Bacillus sp. ISL-18]|uniref:GerAB/ArcD/ProY family transporter n=1 Tax=Bacillus sp. ISL-18 TaxID=2819118 RepID=UPI001BEC3807|nr:endospore germination permease [Bacillus sp. ISL-18]MBT2653924.1 endospore germination permease [Bacillus sp. ISL-18]
MLEKGKISRSQLFILILMFEVGTSILFVPYLVVSTAKQDAWMGILLGICIGLVIVGIYAILSKRYSHLTVVEMNERILGKWAGKGLSILFFFYVLIVTAGLLRIIGDFIGAQILPETPIQAIEIIFILLVIYGTRLGLETFSRTSEMVLPWILLFFFLLIMFLLPEIQFKNLSPYLEVGVKPVIKAAFLSLGIPFADLIIFLMILPSVAPSKKLGKVLVLGTLTGGFILFVVVIMSILVLGPTQTAQLNYPIYVLAQKVNIGDFIQRIEVLTGGMVFITIFIKTTISFYSLTLSFAQIFNLKEFKMLSFPFGIIVVISANIMSPNIIFFHTFLTTTWTPIVLLYGLLLPLLLLGIDTFKIGFYKRKNKLAGSR